MDKQLEDMKSMLWAQQKWPGIYYFKFIVPNDPVKLEAVKQLFADQDKITYRVSRDIRYIAISCKQMMEHPDSVLAIYSAASAIEGVMAL
ncbi:MAG: DUF493 domain-containing protein [Marinilabiliales bacterium]|nr:DUF493 domain-containing protein [Marinilabiliales bacterium]